MTALAALKAPDPLAIEKFTCTFLCGNPLLKTRAVTGALALAPCETYAVAFEIPMSEDDCDALSVSLADFDDEYTPGASVAVMYAAPGADAVSQVAAFPL